MIPHLFGLVLHFLEVGVVFIVMLSVLVAAHEFGHYLFARAFGMGVEEFSIGMGGRGPMLTYYRKSYLLSLSSQEASQLQLAPSNEIEEQSLEKQPVGALLRLEAVGDKGESELVQTPRGPALRETSKFTFRPLPVGGFVRIKGMLPQEDGGETRIPGGFYSKAPWKRFVVLLAGPVFSILAGMSLAIPIFMVQGAPKRINEPVLGSVIEGPAAKAGLRSYDRITSIGGTPVSTFYQIISKVQASSGKALDVQYVRKGVAHKTVVTPEMSRVPAAVFGADLETTGEVSRHPVLGVVPLIHNQKLDFPDAVRMSAAMPLMVVNGLVGVVKRPSTAKDVMGGPGTMIAATSDAVSSGVTEVVMVAAMISISLGILNLLPIYPLDGGQMAVAIAEMLRSGRRLSMRVQNVVGLVGFAAVLLIVACVLTIDVRRLGAKAEPGPTFVSKQKPDN